MFEIQLFKITTTFNSITFVHQIYRPFYKPGSSSKSQNTKYKQHQHKG